MITKLVLTDSYDFGQPATQLVPQLNSGRVDQTWLKKQAGMQCMFDKEISELKKQAGKSVLHVIALGDEENYSCLAAGTPILLASGSYAAIDSLKVGDSVISGAGNIRSVTSTFKRNVQGTVHVTVEGAPDIIVMSNKHPVKRVSPGTFDCVRDKYKMCKPGLSGGGHLCKRGKGCDLSNRSWADIEHEMCTADELTIDDYLVFELPTGHKPPREISVEEARLIGYWLAEGSFGKHYTKLNRKNTGSWRYNKLQFAFGSHEEHTYASDVIEILDNKGIPAQSYVRGSSCTVITQDCSKLVTEYLDWFGTGASVKRLPVWTLALPDEVRENLVYGYLCGDGHVCNSAKESRVTARSASLPLLLGMQRLLWSLGISNGICRVHDQREPIQRMINDRLCVVQPHFNLSYPCERASGLLGFGRSRPGGSKVRTIIVNNVVYLPVRSIQSGGQTDVYNIEVDVDHDYISCNFYSHNCNRNGDAFSEKDTKKAHAQFKDQGHVFANHVNNDPRKAVGTVLATGHNDPMHRIELLIEVDHKKAPKNYVEKLETGDDVAVSMGSSQQYDVCSSCGHKAPTAKQHCDCVKNHLMEVLENGQQIYMKNPNPSFFDISLVNRPADRIGHALRKVAYGNGVIGGHELAEAMNLDPVSMIKSAMLTRLAEMEKHVPVKAHQLNLKKETVRQLKRACECMGNSPVLRMLADKGAVLSPRDFSDIIVGHKDPEGAGEAIESCGGISKLEDPIEIGSLDPGEKRHIDLSDDADDDIHESCGCDAKPFNKRVIRITIIKHKLASVLDTAEASGLAQLYQHYKLAFAVHNFDRPDVLSNLACLP